MDETKERVKLIDFGFSTCIPHEKKIKLFCGTPSYMAPEIVAKVEYSGPPADIWALGVLLFALLCGKFPFKGSNDKELYHAIRFKELQFPDHVSTSARLFIQKLFNKEAEKRISARDILKDPWMQINNHDLKYINANQVHGFVKPSSEQKAIEPASADNKHKLTVINPTNINFAISGSLIAPLLDETS